MVTVPHLVRLLVCGVRHCRAVMSNARPVRRFSPQRFSCRRFCEGQKLTSLDSTRHCGRLNKTYRALGYPIVLGTVGRGEFLLNAWRSTEVAKRLPAKSYFPHRIGRSPPVRGQNPHECPRGIRVKLVERFRGVRFVTHAVHPRLTRKLVAHDERITLSPVRLYHLRPTQI